MSYRVGSDVTFTCLPWTPGYATEDHTCTWAFSDGGQAVGQGCVKSFAEVGTYTATVTAVNKVTNTHGTATTQVKIDTFDWKNFVNLPIAIRNPLTASLPDGSLLVMGGLTTGNVLSNRVFRLYPNGTWVEKAHMNFAKSTRHMNHHVLSPVTSDGRVFVCGCTEIDGTKSKLEVYDYNTNTWTNFVGVWANNGEFGVETYCHLMPDGNVMIAPSGGIYIISTNTIRCPIISFTLQGVGWDSIKNEKVYSQITGDYLSHIGLPFTLKDGRVAYLLHDPPANCSDISDIYPHMPTVYTRIRIFGIRPDYMDPKYDFAGLPDRLTPWEVIFQTSSTLENLSIDSYMADYAMSAKVAVATDGSIYLLGVQNGANGISKYIKLIDSGLPYSLAYGGIFDAPVNLQYVGEVEALSGPYLMMVGVNASKPGSLVFNSSNNTWNPIQDPYDTGIVLEVDSTMGFGHLNGKPVIFASPAVSTDSNQLQIFNGSSVLG